MSPVTIPVHARLLTLQIEEFRIQETTVDVGGRPQRRRIRVRDLRSVPHGHDSRRIAPAVHYANNVFQPADIRFVLTRTTEVSVLSPNGSEQVDNGAFHQLSRQFPGGSGVSLMLVPSFLRGELGGQSLEPQGTCIIERMSQQMMNRVLCHELGHLLELHHEGPGNIDNWNLMYPALRAGDRLDPEQIGAAQRSRLAARAARAAQAGQRVP